MTGYFKVFLIELDSFLKSLKRFAILSTRMHLFTLIWIKGSEDYAGVEIYVF